MHRFTLVVIALASGLSFAHGTRTWHAPSRIVRYARLRSLVSRPVLRYLMLVPEATGQKHLRFAAEVTVLPDEVAAPFLNALVEHEVRIAKRYALPFARVSAQTDLMIELAISGEPLTSALVVKELEALEPLGPAYDDVFLKELAVVKTPVFGDKLPDLSDLFLENLAGNLERAARAGRARVNVRPKSRGPKVRAWLEAPLPKLAWWPPRVSEVPKYGACTRDLLNPPD